MNQNLMDPKLIMLAAVAIRGHRRACFGVRAQPQEYDRKPAAKVWARVRAGGAGAWVRTKSRSEISRIARSGLKSSTFAILIRWNTNGFRNRGSPYSLSFVDSPKGAVTKPMTWCPL